MKWFNILILVGVLGLIAVGSYILIMPKGTQQNIQKFSYYFVTSAYSISNCSNNYTAYSGAILVDPALKPLNISYNIFIGADGHYSNVTLCNRTLTAFVVTKYTKVNNTSMFYCNTNSDCVPSSCCHSTSCVNKAYKPECKNAICTDMRVPGTLDYGTCACVDHKCVAEIEPPVTFK